MDNNPDSQVGVSLLAEGCWPPGVGTFIGIVGPVQKTQSLIQVAVFTSSELPELDALIRCFNK